MPQDRTTQKESLKSKPNNSGIIHWWLSPTLPRFSISKLNQFLFVIANLLFSTAIFCGTPDKRVPVSLMTPQIGSTQWIERATGELIAPRRATLQIKASGIVGQVMIREGDRVKKGQPLAILDLEDSRINLEHATMNFRSVEAQVEAAKAAVETARVTKQQAQIRLETATLDYERAKNLRAKDTIPQQQLDQTEGQYKLAKNGIEVADRQIIQAQTALTAAGSMLSVAKVGIRSAQKRLTDSSLLAPFDGLIVSKSIRENEQSDKQTIFIVDDSDLEFRTRLPERVLPHLVLGTKAFIHSPLATEPVITSVNTIVPSIDLQTLTFEVIGIVPNSGHKLSHGGYADVDIIVREDQGVPILPSNLVKIADDSKQTSQGAPRSGYVFTVRDGKACKTQVTAGITRNNQVSILSGLSSGTPVVDQGFDLLEDGISVVIASETRQ